MVETRSDLLCPEFMKVPAKYSRIHEMSETTNDASEATELNENSEASSPEPTATASSSEDAGQDGLPTEAVQEEPSAPMAAAPAAAVEEDEIPAEPTTFRVSNRLEEKVIDGRLEAVAAAKEWSIETGQSIVVERTDGRVQMGFRDGALVDYVLETRKGRRA